MKDGRQPHETPTSQRKSHPFFRRHTEPPKPHSSSLPRRPVPPTTPPPPVNPATAGPWQHMADTYAWVVEQEFVQVDRKNRTTEQWIFEQKVRFPDTQERRDIEERVRRRMWEEAVNNFDVEAEKWMRHEEELRRMAVERERQKAKALQEELRRYEARIRERRRGEEEIRYRAQHAAAIREREHQERVKGIVEGWERYEKQWASLTASSEPLGFTDIPWPLRTAPKTPEDITPTGVSAFLLSPLHSQNLSRKERIRAAQLRFHPDRALPRLMRRVKEEDKELVYGL